MTIKQQQLLGNSETMLIFQAPVYAGKTIVGIVNERCAYLDSSII